ncbi:MAG TPA: hypothetical protein VJ873_00540, partial [bacterium]|nr:hypothetical protein [bacterium]
SRPSEKDAEALSKRLMLSRVEQKIVGQSARTYPEIYKELGKKGLAMSRMYQLLCPLRPEVQCFLMAAAVPALRKKMEQYFVKIQRLTPWVKGRDLKAQGIPPGFQYSFILLEVLNGQLDGKFKNRKEALGWVKKTFVS